MKLYMETNDYLRKLDFEKFCSFFETNFGILLPKNKQYLPYLRLKNIIEKEGIRTLSQLIERTKDSAHCKLKKQIVDAMTIRETLWFRDSTPFEILKSKIFPEITYKGSKPIRIWSAACSTGQEPFSIGIAAYEFLLEKTDNIEYLTSDFEIVATDISSAALSYAKEGTYDKLALSRGLTEIRKLRFFNSNGKNWQVKNKIRKMVSFKELNLQKSFFNLAKFDVIFCRNVLIYFSDDLKRDILTRFAKALNPKGYLFVGGSEQIAKHTSLFKQVKSFGGLVNQLETNPYKG